MFFPNIIVHQQSARLEFVNKIVNVSDADAFFCSCYEKILDIKNTLNR